MANAVLLGAWGLHLMAGALPVSCATAYPNTIDCHKVQSGLSTAAQPTVLSEGSQQARRAGPT
jgi:hypothetical protein